MSKPLTVATVESQRVDSALAQQRAVTPGPRRIAFHTDGHQHGPVVRLVNPSDIGEVIRPFVFLDHGEIEPTRQPVFGIHPHSGIGTLTVVLSGSIAYEDTTGKKGQIAAGGLEWMKAGNGVWHDGKVLPGEPVRFYQLWIALPAPQENLPPESQYISPDAVQEDGPVRVILGRFGGMGSPIRAPEGINYLHVRLTDGQRWRYTPPAGHTVAWLSVDQGRLRSSQTIDAGQLAVFDEYAGAINLQADGATSFVIGSAIKHPHPLVLGNYSVHTSAEALAQGEAEIRRIGQRLRAEGRL